MEYPANIIIHAGQVNLSAAGPNILQGHQQHIDHPGNHEIHTGKVYNHVGWLFVKDGADLGLDVFHGDDVINALFLESQHHAIGDTPANQLRTIIDRFFTHNLTPIN